jgi:uncharacterized protein YdaU (DUF1376 family)
MAEFPSMPLWTDAYLADTGHLTDAEHGRYLLMLIALWRAPMQRFPNDDTWLSRKFGRSLQVFVSDWKPLMQEFMQNDGNWWTQTRLSKEWGYLHEIRQKRSDSAKSRWNKEKEPCKLYAPTPTPTPHINNKKNGFSGREVTIEDQAERLNRFKDWLARRPDWVGGKTIGWRAIYSASDEADPNHGASLAACKEITEKNGKGWPLAWSTKKTH